MAKTFTVIVYSDPSGSWGKVKRQVLNNLGIANKVSVHSLQLRDNVYLESKRDLALLHDTLSKQDVRIKFVEKHTNRDSKIRSYERFSPA